MSPTSNWEFELERWKPCVYNIMLGEETRGRE